MPPFIMPKMQLCHHLPQTCSSPKISLCSTFLKENMHETSNSIWYRLQFVKIQSSNDLITDNCLFLSPITITGMMVTCMASWLFFYVLQTPYNVSSYFNYQLVLCDDCMRNNVLIIFFRERQENYHLQFPAQNEAGKFRFQFLLYLIFHVQCSKG